MIDDECHESGSSEPFPLRARGDSVPPGECPRSLSNTQKVKYCLFFLCCVFIALSSRYAAEYHEFEELERSCTLTGGDPSLNTSMENTFPDNFSDVNSEDMRMPVPEWMNQVEMEEDFQYPSPEDYEPSLQGGFVDSNRDVTFGPVEATNLRRVIGDACAATPPVLTVPMPWELPGIRLVIGDEEPLAPTPVLYPMPVKDEEAPRPTASHRVARVEHIRGSYHEAIDFKLTLAESEITEARWNRALEKWYTIFARGRTGWPRGHDIEKLVREKGVAGLRTIFGNRSHNTVLKRANSIVRFIHWFTQAAFSITPFPLQSCDVESYLEFLQDQPASPSALSSFVEAVNFCEKVLNIETVGTIITPKVMNLIELADARRKEKKQARVLSVKEVCCLESFLANEKNLVVDRFAAGCFLFALFSRSRWSDLRCVYGHISDILEMEGKITGYLEYKTRSHKTARLVQKQGLSMPLVAPVWGVGKTSWALEFAEMS